MSAISRQSAGSRRASSPLHLLGIEIDAGVLEKKIELGIGKHFPGHPN
jgi:hypothetical protein